MSTLLKLKLKHNTRAHAQEHPPLEPQPLSSMEVICGTLDHMSLDTVTSRIAWEGSKVSMETYLAEVAEVERFLSLILQGSREPSFERCHRAIYHLVTWGRGEVAYGLVRKHLALASRRSSRAVFDPAAQTLAKVAHYLERFSEPRGLIGIEQMAAQLYERPGAAGWRAIARIARWVGLISLCRQAFDEVRLRPGGTGALACANHFWVLAAAAGPDARAFQPPAYHQQHHAGRLEARDMRLVL